MRIGSHARRDAGRLLERAYRLTPAKRILLPLARRWYRAPFADPSCNHVTCDCVWCVHGRHDGAPALGAVIDLKIGKNFNERSERHTSTGARTPRGDIRNGAECRPVADKAQGAAYAVGIAYSLLATLGITISNMLIRKIAARSVR